MRKFFICLFSILLLLTWISLGGNSKSLIEKLDPKYKEWLELVHYIITPTEKKVFFELTNNRDRDTFINLFWKLRDPTKGTPQNEFKEEHIKRFQYANRYYGYESPLPGWKTDRGKIYILLGPPVSKNEIPMKNDLYPIEIWEYFGGPEKGLPTVFRMVFYKKYGSGRFKLYIPAVDGPISLVRTQIGEVEPNDYYEIYKKIKEIEPAVAEICLTLIPGEPLFNFSPSLQGPLLMSKIYELPKKRINASYAKNFLNYKGIVETSVTTDYVNIASDLYILKDPILGLNFVHFAILPERITVEYSEEKDKYYFNFNLIVVLKKGEDVVLQYDKNFPFYYTKEELDEQLSHGIIITDHFPVIQGKFRFITVLQNSLNKEISYFEKMIETVPPETSLPKLYGPLISYRININNQMGYNPFTIMGRSIKIDPKRVFGLRDLLSTLFYIEKGNYNKNFHVELEVEGLDESKKNEYLKKYTFVFPEGKTYWCFTKDLEKLKYGNYSLKAKIVGESGIILDVKENEFQVSPHSYVPHPPLASRKLGEENKFMFYFYMAAQYQAVKQYSKAESFYEKALQLNNAFPSLIKSYASFLLDRKKYDKMLSVIENLKGQEKEMFDYYALKGRALYYKKDYNACVESLLEANKIYDSDISVINTLGFALIGIGEKAEAIKALSASLKIDAHQNNISEILKQLKNETRGDTNEKK